jgi:hypothetical protein
MRRRLELLETTELSPSVVTLAEEDIDTEEDTTSIFETDALISLRLLRRTLRLMLALLLLRGVCASVSASSLADLPPA